MVVREDRVAKWRVWLNPVEQISMWFQLSLPNTLESTCSNDEGVQQQVQRSGELVQDVSVATEVIIETRHIIRNRRSLGNAF